MFRTTCPMFIRNTAFIPQSHYPGNYLQLAPLQPEPSLAPVTLEVSGQDGDSKTKSSTTNRPHSTPSSSTLTSPSTYRGKGDTDARHLYLACPAPPSVAHKLYSFHMNKTVTTPHQVDPRQCTHTRVPSRQCTNRVTHKGCANALSCRNDIILHHTPARELGNKSFSSKGSGVWQETARKLTAAKGDSAQTARKLTGAKGDSAQKVRKLTAAKVDSAQTAINLTPPRDSALSTSKSPPPKGGNNTASQKPKAQENGNKPNSMKSLPAKADILGNAASNCQRTNEYNPDLALPNRKISQVSEIVVSNKRKVTEVVVKEKRKRKCIPLSEETKAERNMVRFAKKYLVGVGLSELEDIYDMGVSIENLFDSLLVEELVSSVSDRCGGVTVEQVAGSESEKMTFLKELGLLPAAAAAVSTGSCKKRRYRKRYHKEVMSVLDGGYVDMMCKNMRIIGEDGDDTGHIKWSTAADKEEHHAVIKLINDTVEGEDAHWLGVMLGASSCCSF